ncbi:hypothetical protein SLS62_001867 [Diatrype stigma]|uniref:Uncharacterized protein n=1 Tax=Diatrype stigma TaxID=117547 RepID=A0AAN9UZA4_9PEZI
MHLLNASRKDSDEDYDTVFGEDSDEGSDTTLSEDDDEDYDYPLTWMIAGQVPMETIYAVINICPNAVLQCPERLMLQACTGYRTEVVRLLMGPEFLQYVVNSVVNCMSKVLLSLSKTTNELEMLELVGILAFQGGLEEESPDSPLTHNHVRLWLGYCLNPYMPDAITAMILVCALRHYPQIIPRFDEQQRAAVLLTLDAVKNEPDNGEAAELAKFILRMNAHQIIRGFDMEFLFDSGIGGDHYSTLFAMILGDTPRTYSSPPADYSEIQTLCWGRMVLDQIMPGIDNSPGDICTPMSYIVLSLWRPKFDGTRASLDPPADLYAFAQKVVAADQDFPGTNEHSVEANEMQPPSLFKRT